MTINRLLKQIDEALNVFYDENSEPKSIIINPFYAGLLIGCHQTLLKGGLDIEINNKNITYKGVKMELNHDVKRHIFYIQ